MKPSTPHKTAGEVLSYVEKIVYVIVGVLLVVMAAYTIIGSLHDIIGVRFNTEVTFQLTTVLNDALFVIILMELLGTVATHLSKGGFQLKSFLIIGVISSVRRILVIGAQLSASQNEPSSLFNRGIIELGVDAAVVIILTVALVLSRRMETSKKSADPGHDPIEID